MMDNQVDITDLLKQIAELKKENKKLKLQQLNKSSESPNTGENEEKQLPQDDSLPSTSKSKSIEAILLPSTSSIEFNKISTNTPDAILVTTDNSGNTCSKQAQNENYRDQFIEYKKRKGTDDQGKEYEYLMCAYYALKLCFDKNVTDFEITTNNEDYGNLDDVALKVTFLDNSSHRFLMQLKHTEQRKGITDKMLSADEKGDFSLFKYSKSFKNLQDRDNIICIVFTNRKSHLNDKSEFKLEDESIIANQCQPHNNINHLLIDTVSGDESPHIFNFKQNGQHSQSFEEFFKSFYLFTNQKSSSNMQSHIDELLYERFGYKVDFIAFMRQWWKGKFVLHKHDIIVKLAELILSPFVQEIPNDVNEPLSDKAKLLKNAIMQFEMTLAKDCDASAIAKIWIEETADLEMMRKASLKYGLATRGFRRLPPQEFTKVLWYLNKVPLIVKYDKKGGKRIRAAIELLEMETNKKKLILVGHKSKKALSKWTIFESLFDLRTDSIYKEIIAAFKVSLQGRQSIRLEKFINSVTEMAKIIEIKELFLMLEKDPSIGKQLPSLPVVYIPRILSCDKIFVNKSRSNPLMYNPRDLSGYHALQDEDFDRSLVKRNEIFDNTSIDETRAFTTFNNPVNIITGKPGIGKSTLMTYLSHQCPPDYWCIRINLINYSKFFSRLHSTEEIMNEFVKDEDAFFDKVKGTFRQNKKIYLLLDGLDEIGANCVETVLTFIKDISSNGIRIWISSREHLKEKVSKYLKTSPITIKELTKENQEKYIEQRLSNNPEGVNYTEDEVNKIITRLFASVNVAYNAENILGVPLLLFIITEIFRKDKSNFERIIINEDIFVLTKMYKIFFEGKEKHLYKKAGVQNKEILDNDLDDKLERYELPALEASASELLPKLGLHGKKMTKSQKFLERIRHKGDPLGIISKVVGERNKYRAIFAHQSFAEYFACVWLRDNREKLELIKDSFFEDNNDNLRLIFDIMLAEDNLLHLAVLYKDRDLVEKYINHYDDKHEDKDKGGRTALHLLSSYSRKDSILRIYTNFERIPKDLEMYHLLLKTCNAFEKDELFKWNCLDYALCRYSLLLFEILLEKNKELTDNIDINMIIERFHDVNQFTGSCCLYGYFHLLKLTFLDNNRNSDVKVMKIEVDVVNEKDKMTTPLHLASVNGNANIIELLLNKGCEINEGNESNYTPLHFACWFGTPDVVIKFLESGGDLNSVNNMQETPLHLASAGDDTEIIELLLKKGCKINVANKDNWTPLHFACFNGKYKTVIKLLELGGDLNAVTYQKQTPLHLASANGKTEIIELLLKRGCKISEVDKNNLTLLHYACYNGQYDAVIKILELGGDLNAVTNKKQTLLHLASENGKAEVLELLLNKGCKVNVADEDNLTSLHYACWSGKYDAVIKILEFGGDLNAVTNKKQTPLHLASENGNTEIIELLLMKGCKVNVVDEVNLTPLHYACWNGKYDAVIKILELGGDLNAVANKKRTPLHLASANGQTEIIEQLLMKGCEVNVGDENNLTSLHYACFCGKYDAVIKILELGGDINAVTNKKQTPLHLASANENAHNIVDLLFRKGSKINVTDENNWTPLHYACLHANSDTVMKIIELGGDLNAVTNGKVTPLHLASGNGKTEVIELLLKKGCTVNVADENNLTPLHYACNSGSQNAVLKILELVCDITDENLSTLLRYALDKNNYEDIEKLVGTSTHHNAEHRNFLSQNFYDIFYNEDIHLVEMIFERMINMGISSTYLQFPLEFPIHLVARDGYLQLELVWKMIKLINKYRAKYSFDEDSSHYEKSLNEYLIANFDSKEELLSPSASTS